jgi:hypothetical protein
MRSGRALLASFLAGVFAIAPAAGAPKSPKLQRGVLAGPEAVPLAPELQLTGTLRQFPAGAARARLASLLEGRWTLKDRGNKLGVRLSADSPLVKSLSPKKPHALKLEAEGRKLDLLFYVRHGDWFAAPAAVLGGRLGRDRIEFLDADLDGRFDEDEDCVRFRGGAFRRCATSRLLPIDEELARFEIGEEARKPVVVLTPLPRPEGLDDDMWRAQHVFNAFRNGVGLAPVALDIERCDGCRKHARYLKLNGDSPRTPLENSHDEEKGKPGYTPEGHEAALRTCISHDPDPGVAIGEQTRTLFHRLWYLGPSEAGFAVGSKKGSRVAGVPGYCVIWGAMPRVPAGGRPVVVPGPGQTGVPRACKGEYPRVEGRPHFYSDPRGYPISVSFGEIPLSGFGLELRDEAGRPVPGTLFSPEAPIVSSRPRNRRTAFFVAHGVLAAEARYEATFTADLAGPGGKKRPVRLTWSFRTGKKERTDFE